MYETWCGRGNLRDGNENMKDIKCPVCKAKMVPRNGKRGWFFGCARYPACKGAREIYTERPSPLCHPSEDALILCHSIDQLTEKLTQQEDRERNARESLSNVSHIKECIADLFRSWQ